ncbi:hypothetical protein [Hydrogenimonas sp.]
MIVEKRLQLHHPIVAIKGLEGDRVAIVDNNYTVRFFSTDPIELVGGFKTSIQPCDPATMCCDLSFDGKYAAMIVPKDGAVVYDAVEKHLLFRFRRHEGEVESLKISDSHEYLATGGQDGKTFIWSLMTGRMVASLPHHSDFVTAIDFSSNGQWIATGGFDRRVLVTNISSLSQWFRLSGHGSAITVLKFIEGHRLVVGDKDGQIVVWDYFNSKPIKRLKKMFDTVTDLATTPDDRFLFASDKTGAVSLYDLGAYTLVSQRYFSFGKSVRRLCYIDSGNHLAVGLDSGEVSFNAPFKESSIMEEMIEKGDLASAYELAKENPLLHYSDAYIRLESLWNDAFKKAIERMEAGDKESAKTLLEPFNVEKSKRLLIQQLLNGFEEFQRFRSAVEAKRYQLAYSLAALYPIFQESHYYALIEEEWNRVFAKAKKLILQNRGEEMALELLKPFRGISSKGVLIQTLLTDREIYRLFMKLIAKKDFKGAMDLAKRHPAIMQLGEYKKIQRIADALEQKAQEELATGHYAEAVRIASKLQEFPGHKEMARELREKANLYASAMRYFAQKDYAAIYQMLERHPYLEETKIVQDLENSWKKAVKKAELYAAQGDTESIRELLAPFVKLPQKRFKIVSLFKQAYIAQIERAAKEDRSKLLDGIRAYVDIFGVDDEIWPLLKTGGLQESYRNGEAVDIISIDWRALPDRIV